MAPGAWFTSFKNPQTPSKAHIKETSDGSSTSPASLDEAFASSPPPEESLEARIERLGRERPSAFNSLHRETAFVFSILMSQILTEYFVSGFTVLIPTLIKKLNIPESASVWPATAFSVVIASTLLLFGRLGDIFGGYYVYLFGLTWMCVWSIVAGFSINPLMLDFCRALQGLGAAAFLPTGVMLMGSVYRPGPRKNLVFALYGTCAVVGFFIGILLAGIVGQYLNFGWYFWIGAIFTAITLATSIFSIPNDHSERRNSGTKMDYLGSILIISSLVLIIVSITESAHAPHGWRTPYIPTIFTIGILLLLAAIYVEGWVASQPLLPASIFRANRAMLPLTIALLLLYGNIGIFLLYGTQYFQNILSATPLQIVAWYVPLLIGGVILSTLEGLIMHIVPGRILLIISALGATISQLLLALLPIGANYWAWIFPSLICTTIGIDLSYNLMTVFVTTVLPRHHQGLGGGLINSVLQLGIAFSLGFTDIIQTYTVQRSSTPESLETLRLSYKNTFWFGVAGGATSLVLMAVWGKIPKAKSELTADEKMELERVATRDLELERRASRVSRAGGGL